MKNWLELVPDRVKLMNRHYTPGRGGQSIRYVVIHHNAGVLSIDQIWQVWQDRPASAHYQVTSSGEIGQLVWDRDTAWHAANLLANQQSIGIEVSNSGGSAQGWPISDKAIEEAAHLVAAVCLYYHLGRPVSGVNVKYHRDFWSTSCPYHLAPGGKYNHQLISRAQYWYDQMTKPTLKERVMPTITLGGISAAALNEAKLKSQQAAGISADNQVQLRGPDLDGWSVDWLAEQYAKRDGDKGTIPELLAVTLHEVRELRKEVSELKGAA